MLPQRQDGENSLLEWLEHLKLSWAHCVRYRVTNERRMLKLKLQLSFGAFKIIKFIIVVVLQATPFAYGAASQGFLLLLSTPRHSTLTSPAQSCSQSLVSRFETQSLFCGASLHIYRYFHLLGSKQTLKDEMFFNNVQETHYLLPAAWLPHFLYYNFIDVCLYTYKSIYVYLHILLKHLIAS